MTEEVKKMADIKMYDIEDLMKELDISRRTITIYLEQGKIKGRKIARKWYVSEDNLRAFLNGTDEDN